MHLDPNNVRQIASNWGYCELSPDSEDHQSTLCFRNDKKCGGVRVKVNITSGSVATQLDQPCRGKTQLYRRQVGSSMINDDNQ